MNPHAEVTLKRVVYNLLGKYKEAAGTNVVRARKPSLNERQMDLPPLSTTYTLGVPLQTLIREVYAAVPMDRPHFKTMWGYLASIVRGPGWVAGKPFYEFVSQAFPDLKQPDHMPRGVQHDVRGFLCQTLCVANMRMEGTTFHTRSFEAYILYRNRVLGGIGFNAITWDGGHYIRRSADLGDIDYRLWAERPLIGSRALTPEAAVLRLKLVKALRAETNAINAFFQCLAALGSEACNTATDAFDVYIDDADEDNTVLSASILLAQRQLKAKR